ncbi:MAG: transposase [Bdellovibrionales bacterium]|nr:transposase [Bdellovibrionales bacterium]
MPPYSPELNPIEQVWGYLKSNFCLEEYLMVSRIFSIMECGRGDS